MNVSFTRARKKLVIVGSRTTLEKAPLLAEFFKLMESRDWILQLPTDAHLMHKFDEGSDTPKKRRVEEMLCDAGVLGELGADEKAKRRKNAVVTEEGLLKGRPLLRDLVNDCK